MFGRVIKKWIDWDADLLFCSLRRSLEEDIEVCHLLIDSAVMLSGRNFIKAIQIGCLDVVER